jgi:hypothetical protein
LDGGDVELYERESFLFEDHPELLERCNFFVQVLKQICGYLILFFMHHSPP